MKETSNAERRTSNVEQKPRRRLGICGARLGVPFGSFAFLQEHSGVLQRVSAPLLNAKTDEEALGIVSALLNRKADGNFEFPVDNWYLIAPIGDHPHSESGLVQVVDRESVEAMANSMPAGKELLVDFDHESWSGDKRTTAGGWIQNLAARAEGLWAQIRWSGSGRRALRNGDYRFISPVWTFANCQQIDPTHVRPLKLSDAGLTNRPNLSGLPAMSNRERGDAQPHAEDTADQNRKEQMKKVATELGLSADASEDSVVQAIAQLKNSASAAGRVADLEKDNTELKNTNRTLLEATVESDLDTAGLEGDDRVAFKAQLLTNREGTLPLLATLTKARGNATAKALTNRSGAKTPGGTGSGVAAADEDEATVATKVNDAIANAKGTSFEERFENAKRSNPDLFKPRTAQE